MVKYDLNDIGFNYKGISTSKTKSAKIEGSDWVVDDIPVDVDTNDAISFVKNFIKGITAIEIPTSLVCNLRCRYCYIDDPRMKNKVVSSDVVHKILKESSEMFPSLSPDEKVRKSLTKDGKVYLSPWGAEPFANISTLETMQQFARETYGKGNYKLNTSTNGTFWNKRIENLFHNMIVDEAFTSIQVSLDGPKSLQDFQRPILGGAGSYDKIENFVGNLSHLSKEHNLKNRPYTFCSTIHLKDEKFADNWIAAAEFFSTPNKWYTSLPVLPMRMSGEDMDNKELVNRFLDAQRKMVELVKRRTKENITTIDFYSYKLFGNTSSRSKNAFPYCSALNTQIGVDVDGSLYPCHGPITTPMQKPFLWYGNLFDKVISYRQLYRNFSYQYGTLWTRARCVDCPVYNYSSGNVCWSCPIHNLGVTEEPSMDSLHKCFAYEQAYKYWIQIAKMTINNPILNDIPSGWFNDNSVNLPIVKNPIEAIDKNSHFNMAYDGMIDRGIRRFIPGGNFENVQFKDSWWNFNNYIEIINK